MDEGSDKMIWRFLDWLRARREVHVLNRMAAYRYPDDIPSLALKIATQRSKGTTIGRRCRLLGMVDSVNPHLISIGDYCVIGSDSILLAHGPNFDGNMRTVVGDYTYIGYRVTVLPGVSIGQGSIIGARVLGDVTAEEEADIRDRLHNDRFFGHEGTTL